MPKTKIAEKINACQYRLNLSSEFWLMTEPTEVAAFSRDWLQLKSSKIIVNVFFQCN